MDRSIHWAICRQTVAALSPRAHPRTGSAHMQIMSKLFNFLEARTHPIALCRSSSLGIGFCFLHKCFPCTGSFYDFFRWTWNSSWDLRNVLPEESWRVYCFLISSVLLSRRTYARADPLEDPSAAKIYGEMHNSFSHSAAKIQRILDRPNFDSNVNYFDCLHSVLRARNRYCL